MEKINEQAMQYRNQIKILGGKALIGSVKQKNWAEEIRYNIISHISYEIASELLNESSPCYIFSKYAKFWIVNRNKKLSEFTEFVNQYPKLHEATIETREKINYSGSLKISDKFSAAYALAKQEEDDFIKKWYK